MESDSKKRSFSECLNLDPISLAVYLTKNAHCHFLKHPDDDEEDDAGVDDSFAVVLDEVDDEMFDQCLQEQFDHHIPAQSDRGFVASRWQEMVLSHMESIRLQNGHSVGLLTIATGVGKTVISILDIERQIFSFKNARRLCYDEDLYDGVACDGKGDFKLLFIVHSEAIKVSICYVQRFLVCFNCVLFSQLNAYRKYVQHFGRFFDKSCFYNHKAQSNGKIAFQKNTIFVFALFQSFEKLQDVSFSHVVIDEVHHCLAPSYKSIVDNVMETSQYVLGMTATMTHRIDPRGSQIRKLFLDTVYIEFDWIKAKKKGFFPEVEYLECLPLLQNNQDIPSYNQILSEFKERGILTHFLGKLEKSLVQCKMTDGEVKKMTADYIVDQILSFQKARVESGLKQREKIVIFASNINQCDEIAKKMKQLSKLKVQSLTHKTGNLSFLRSFCLNASLF